MPHQLSLVATAAFFGSLASSQMIGTTPENHPPLTTWQCTIAGGCVQQATSVVVDFNYHWLRTADYTSCSTTDPSEGGTEAALGTNCYIEGVNYTSTGIFTSGDKLTLDQYVLNNGTYQNSSPRVYLLAPDGQNYEALKLLGQEISFDVDASTLVCGENGALYLSEMDISGGRTNYNPGGAAYGAGYCDAQCPTGTWYNGSLNTAGYGSCCNEMDLWEANANATALTPHPCSGESVSGCTGTECGASGFCDKNGCGFNPYALGQKSYYGAGPGFTIDTTKPVTVTTSFLTDDGTTTGKLIEIRRSYIQNGVMIANTAAPASSGFPGQTSLTEPYCTATDSEGTRLGGLATMGEALGRGMVLIFSVWNDAGGYMNWLDSGNSGPCSATEGNPSLIIQQTPYTSVTFSNVRWGDIGSTTGGKKPMSSSSSTMKMSSTTMKSSSSTMSSMKMSSTTSSMKMSSTSSLMKPSSTKASSTSSAAGPMQTHWGQCGGKGYSGPTKCASPWTCKVSNDYYSQCL